MYFKTPSKIYPRDYNCLKLYHFHKTSYLLVSIMDPLNNPLKEQRTDNFRDWSFPEVNK